MKRTYRGEIDISLTEYKRCRAHQIFRQEFAIIIPPIFRATIHAFFKHASFLKILGIRFLFKTRHRTRDMPGRPRHGASELREHRRRHRAEAGLLGISVPVSLESIRRQAGCGVQRGLNDLRNPFYSADQAEMNTFLFFRSRRPIKSQYHHRTAVARAFRINEVSLHTHLMCFPSN